MEQFSENIQKILGSPFWELSFYVFIFCLIVLWLALVVWTYKDARKRIDDLDNHHRGGDHLSGVALYGYGGLRHLKAGRIPCGNT